MACGKPNFKARLDLFGCVLIICQLSVSCYFLVYMFYLFTNLDVPVVNVPRSIYRAHFGSDITLDCHVTSNPFHTSVYWERIINDHMIEITTNSAKYGGSTVNNPSLTIYSFTANDIGSYRCLAVNSISTGESQLTVLGVIGRKFA